MNPVKLTLSVSDLRKADACNLDERIADLTAHLGHTPAEDEQIDLKVWLDLPSTSHDDAIWALRAAQPKTDAARVSFFVAKAAADRVAHLLPVKKQTIITDAAAYAAQYANDAAVAAYVAAAAASTQAADAAYAAAAASTQAAEAVNAAAVAAAARAAVAAAAHDAAKAASRAELLSVLA